MNKVKTGQDVNIDFFKKLKEERGLDKDIVEVLVKLFEEKSLTKSTISNKLEEIRIKQKRANENKGN